MKWGVLRTVCTAVLSSVLFTPSFSQNYYLVVGAFSTENEKIKEFTSVLPAHSNDTAYTISTNNSLLHFYVLKTTDKDLAIAKSIKLRESLQASRDQSPLLISPPRSGNPAEQMDPAGRIPEPEVYAVAGSSKTTSELTPSSEGIPLKPKGKFFKFTIATAEGSAIPGVVHHVDLEREREVGSFVTDSYVDMLRPGKNQPMTMVCGVFGYKEVEKYIDYSNPGLTEGAYQDEQGAWVIPYTLEPLETGDVSVMYNVSFYKDAVPMLPASKKDLDNLLSLMKQNPDYMIKVHAHCNGKNSRKIIMMENATDFFSANESIQLKGSAKELTNLRAEAVRSYLTSNGIAKDRIRTYGWGGSFMLVDEHGLHSKMNDRIEIEILKD